MGDTVVEGTREVRAGESGGAFAQIGDGASLSPRWVGVLCVLEPSDPSTMEEFLLRPRVGVRLCKLVLACITLTRLGARRGSLAALPVVISLTDRTMKSFSRDS